MWHEDLLAWQTVRQTTLVSPVGPSAIQLCKQDPTRVWLSISVIDGLQQVYLKVWPVVVGDLGIPLGSSNVAITGSITHFQAVAAIAGGTLTGTFGPGGDTWDGTYVTDMDEFALNWPDPDIVDLNASAIQIAPQERVFRWPEDGIMAAQAWGVSDTLGGQTFFVSEVLMQNRPCPTWRMPNGAYRSRMRVQGGNQPISGSGNNVNPLAWPKCAPPGVDILPDESQ